MIKSIRIQNFKSLRDVTVELSPVTVLIGKSGTGKSNFVSAIRFLRDCLAKGGQNPLDNGLAACRCATNPAGAIRFEIVFTVPGYPGEFTYILGDPKMGLFHASTYESLSYGDHIVFKQVSRSVDGGPDWEVPPRLVSPPPPGPLALPRLPGLEEAVIAYVAITTGIGIYTFSQTVLQAGSALPSRPFNGNAGGLIEDASNFMAVVRDISSSLHDFGIRKGIVAALQRINATVRSIELDSLTEPKNAVVGHALGDKVVPLELRQESDGFRRFYAHLLALYQTPPKQTLIFEEPENGIYPGALSLLAEEFKAAPESDRGQVLLTTHSPALLDHFSADQIRVVELVDLETRIGPLAEEQKESLQEELLHAGELLTVDPARRQPE